MAVSANAIAVGKLGFRCQCLRPTRLATNYSFDYAGGTVPVIVDRQKPPYTLFLTPSKRRASPFGASQEDTRRVARPAYRHYGYDEPESTVTEVSYTKLLTNPRRCNRYAKNGARSAPGLASQTASV